MLLRFSFVLSPALLPNRDVVVSRSVEVCGIGANLRRGRYCGLFRAEDGLTAHCILGTHSPGIFQDAEQCRSSEHQHEQGRLRRRYREKPDLFLTQRSPHWPLLSENFHCRWIKPRDADRFNISRAGQSNYVRPMYFSNRDSLWEPLHSRALCGAVER